MTLAQESLPATQFDAQPNFDIAFPPLPRTVGEVSLMIAEQEDIPDTPRLVEIVNADPVVSAAVLRRVNSAYYGLRRQVDNIRQAVFLLGFGEVSNLVMTSGMMHLRDVIDSPEQERMFEQIMRMSVGAASFGQAMAEHLALPFHKKAFTIGLLHAVGRLVLLYNKPENYEALWYTTPSGMLPSEAEEQAIFGIGHPSLGGLAARTWNLPVLFADVIESYPRPEGLPRSPERLAATTLAAAVAATEHLYLEKAEAKVKSLAPMLGLRRLADATDGDLAALADLIAERQDAVYAFAEAMINA